MGHRDLLVTHTILLASADCLLLSTRSVRRASGFVLVGHSEKGSVPDREREVGFATLNSRIARDPTAMAIAGSSPIDHESLPRIRAIVRPDLARPNSTSGSARSNSKVFWFEAGFCGKCFQCSPRPLAVDQRQRLSAVPNSFTDNIGLRRLS